MPVFRDLRMLHAGTINIGVHGAFFRGGQQFLSAKTVFCSAKQGRSCKQISWPPGIGGLQGVGLDPGQHDHHPHGVVHVGQLQDV